MEMVKGFYVATFYGAIVDVPAGAITLPDAEGKYHHYKVVPREGYTNSCAGNAPFSLIEENGAEWIDRKPAPIEGGHPDPDKDDWDWPHTGVINVIRCQVRGAWDEKEPGEFRVSVLTEYCKD